MTEYSDNSPDWTHRVRFIYCGEVRFGPPYYHVELDGKLLRRWWMHPRHFGRACVWSADSRYVALQEWREVAESPDTEVRVIRLQTKRERGAFHVRGASAEPVRFEGGKLVCTVISTDAKGRRREEEEHVEVGLI